MNAPESTCTTDLTIRGSFVRGHITARGSLTFRLGDPPDAEDLIDLLKEFKEYFGDMTVEAVESSPISNP